jgi:hypothetical protein
LFRARYFLFQAALVAILGGMMGNSSTNAQDHPLALTNTVAGLSLGSAPSTVSLTPLPEFAPALRAAQDRVTPVVLAIEGITGQPVRPLRINVFVGKPDATPKTSTDDPHFAGYIAIDPKYAGGKAQGIEVSRALDVSNLGISTEAQGVDVTLVPVAGINEVPSSLSLRVRQIYLRRE